MIGHRGLKNLCPENTLESFNKAFDTGLKYIELDVKVSKDQIPIILHDDSLERTTNHFGLPTDYNYNELKKLDAGAYFYNKETNIIIPKLIDVLELCKKRNRSLNIELKPNKGFEKINVKKVIEVINCYNNTEMFFSSFDLESFIEISNQLPNSNRSFLIDTFNDYSLEQIVKISSSYNSNICGLNISLLSQEIINIIKKANLLITVYSDQNISLQEVEECFNLGVDSIFIDDLKDLSKYL
ncbi:MAG: glycerophosphodiester phosphodiesterase family protein [Alphaproteobacteria bacterium]